MKRLEEMKAKVSSTTSFKLTVPNILSQMSAKKLARVRKRQGRSKKVNH